MTSFIQALKKKGNISGFLKEMNKRPLSVTSLIGIGGAGALGEGALQEKKQGGMIKEKYQNGGEMPFDLPLRSANPSAPYAYEQPMMGNYILPDPNRPELLNTGATEYKMGVDDALIPTVVSGNYMNPDDAYERYRLTGEQFLPTAPNAYSRFYDEIGKLGIMQNVPQSYQNGGEKLAPNRLELLNKGAIENKMEAADALFSTIVSANYINQDKASKLETMQPTQDGEPKDKKTLKEVEVVAPITSIRDPRYKDWAKRNYEYTQVLNHYSNLIKKREEYYQRWKDRYLNSINEIKNTPGSEKRIAELKTALKYNDESRNKVVAFYNSSINAIKNRDDSFFDERRNEWEKFAKSDHGPYQRESVWKRLSEIDEDSGWEPNYAAIMRKHAGTRNRGQNLDDDSFFVYDTEGAPRYIRLKPETLDLQIPDSPFSTREEGNKFRAWVNENHPDIAKELNLDKSGSNNNLYIRSAWAELGDLYTNNPNKKEVQGPLDKDGTNNATTKQTTKQVLNTPKELQKKAVPSAETNKINQVTPVTPITPVTPVAAGNLEDFMYSGRKAEELPYIEEVYQRTGNVQQPVMRVIKPNQHKANGGTIVDPMGQWAHPGQVTTIPSNNITMQGVPYPVLGVSNTGDTKMMKPNKNYKFKGDSVTEYPMVMQDGSFILNKSFDNAIKNNEITLPKINQEIYQEPEEKPTSASNSQYSKYKKKREEFDKLYQEAKEKEAYALQWMQKQAENAAKNKGNIQVIENVYGNIDALKSADPNTSIAIYPAGSRQGYTSLKNIYTEDPDQAGSSEYPCASGVCVADMAAGIRGEYQGVQPGTYGLYNEKKKSGEWAYLKPGEAVPFGIDPLGATVNWKNAHVVKGGNPVYDEKGNFVGFEDYYDTAASRYINSSDDYKKFYYGKVPGEKDNETGYYNYSPRHSMTADDLAISTFLGDAGPVYYELMAMERQKEMEKRYQDELIMKNVKKAPKRNMKKISSKTDTRTDIVSPYGLSRMLNDIDEYSRAAKKAYFVGGMINQGVGMLGSAVGDIGSALIKDPTKAAKFEGIADNAGQIVGSAAGIAADALTGNVPGIVSNSADLVGDVGNTMQQYGSEDVQKAGQVMSSVGQIGSVAGQFMGMGQNIGQGFDMPTMNKYGGKMKYQNGSFISGQPSITDYAGQVDSGNIGVGDPNDPRLIAKYQQQGNPAGRYINLLASIAQRQDLSNDEKIAMIKDQVQRVGGNWNDVRDALLSQNIQDLGQSQSQVGNIEAFGPMTLEGLKKWQSSSTSKPTPQVKSSTPTPRYTLPQGQPRGDASVQAVLDAEGIYNAPAGEGMKDLEGTNPNNVMNPQTSVMDMMDTPQNLPITPTGIKRQNGGIMPEGHYTFLPSQDKNLAGQEFNALDIIYPSSYTIGNIPQYMKNTMSPSEIRKYYINKTKQSYKKAQKNKMSTHGGSFAYGGKKDNGGEIIEYNPNASTHEESPYGGIPVGQNALLEGNETSYQFADGSTYVFSDRVANGKYARKSKDIKRKFSLRDDVIPDPLDAAQKEIEMRKLAETHEIERQTKMYDDAIKELKSEKSRIMKMGGNLYARGGKMCGCGGGCMKCGGIKKYEIGGPEQDPSLEAIQEMTDLYNTSKTATQLGLNFIPMLNTNERINTPTLIDQPFSLPGEGPVIVPEAETDVTGEEEMYKPGLGYYAGVAAPLIYNTIRGLSKSEQEDIYDISGRVSPYQVNMDEAYRAAQMQNAAISDAAKQTASTPQEYQELMRRGNVDKTRQVAAINQQKENMQGQIDMGAQRANLNIEQYNQQAKADARARQQQNDAVRRAHLAAAVTEGSKIAQGEAQRNMYYEQLKRMYPQGM